MVVILDEVSRLGRADAGLLDARGALKEVRMSANQDVPLRFHQSLDDLLDTFRNVITSMTWLKVSVESAERFYEDYPYIIELPASVSSQLIKIDKSILSLVKREGFNRATPLYSKAMVNLYRVFTIAAKDIVWEQDDFKPFLKTPELQFLRHLRNASAHDNQFFWGLGGQRKTTLQQLPVSWRGKVIEERLEGSELYMDFFKPGDIFLLLSDISSLALSKSG